MRVWGLNQERGIDIPATQPVDLDFWVVRRLLRLLHGPGNYLAIELTPGRALRISVAMDRTLWVETETLAEPVDAANAEAVLRAAYAGTDLRAAASESQAGWQPDPAA